MELVGTGVLLPDPRKEGFLVSTPQDDSRQFLTTMSRWLVSLPHDLRILFEAKDEPNLDRVAREAAARPDVAKDHAFAIAVPSLVHDPFSA